MNPLSSGQSSGPPVPRSELRRQAYLRGVCPICGSAVPSSQDHRPGTWAAIAAGLDEYHAVNLREALKLVPDTGDWHGSLRAAIDIVLRERGTGMGPNQTAEQMGAHTDA